MKDTITISDTVTTVADTAPATATAIDAQPVKRKHHHRRAGYAVTNEELLYEISNAGMLFALRGVTGTADNRMYHFDRCPDVKSIIDKFNDHNEVGA